MNEAEVKGLVEQLEYKHMLSYGSILALDVALKALIFTHPDKVKLNAVFTVLQGAADRAFENMVLMVDDVSPSGRAAYDQFLKALAEYQGAILSAKI